jgi:arginine/ornithine N-succinyltransferase beta subunit
MTYYLVFNTNAQGEIDGVHGITSSAPANSPNRKYKAEFKNLPSNLFDGRVVQGVTVLVYNETERQFFPSLFFSELTRKDGTPQFAVEKKTRPVLDTSLAIR